MDRTRATNLRIRARAAGNENDASIGVIGGIAAALIAIVLFASSTSTR